MKNTLFAFLIGILISVGMPGRVSAKGTTVKIMIVGAWLPSAIEVTDPARVSTFSVWTGGFIDSSRGVVPNPAAGRRPYEVFFYVKLGEDDVRMMYVAYYYPDPSTEQGHMYLPGKGDRWYPLNASSIERVEDGKLLYASRAWENLIKPLIAGAEAGAARHRGSER